MKLRFALLFCCLLPILSQAQLKINGSFLESATEPNKPRQIAVNSFIGGAYGLSMFALGSAWYAGEDLVAFHFFDDSHQWKQMDKVGHAWSAFMTSNVFMGMNRWTGMPRETAMWLGAAEGFLAVSSVELFDAFGETWGFSWSDIGANLSGSLLALLNEALWQENRIMLKWNYLPSPYAGDPDFERLFGSSPAEWILKDYNGQSYWLSVQPYAFLPESRFKEKFPKYLNVALGYGAFGLEGGYEDPNGSWTTREYRQYYLGIDLNLGAIQTRSHGANLALDLIDFIRIPLPAVRRDREGWGVELR